MFYEDVVEIKLTEIFLSNQIQVRYQTVKWAEEKWISKEIPATIIHKII